MQQNPEIIRSATVTIVNERGLHARAATQLVNLANTFKSDIQLFCKNNQGNAKQILDVLTLAAVQGNEITITAIGEDGQHALEQLCYLIQNGFGEL